MGARLRVFLTPEQDKILLNLRTVDVPQKVKDRAEVIRLNAHGWYVEKIAAHFKWTSQSASSDTPAVDKRLDDLEVKLLACLRKWHFSSRLIRIYNRV